MSIPKKAKQRKPKVTKAQTLARRRELDRKRRQGQREHLQRWKQRRRYGFRVRVVRYYRGWRKKVSEKEAVAKTLERWGPKQPGHFPLCASSIRQWHRRVGAADWSSLQGRSSRPKTVHSQVAEPVVSIIFMLRTVLGWGGHRIAREMEARGIASVTGRTVYQVLARLGLPIQGYALKGRSEGIASRRYEKQRPNEQWHIDLKHLTLSDGTKGYICVLVDDYSRYGVAAVVGTAATSEWVKQVVEAAIGRAGQPDELVSDNGREFVSVWEESLTVFGRLLVWLGIEHRTCAPYYPQGNGKAEAFVKTLERELLSRQRFATLEELQAALDQFLIYYNHYRLHSSLGWQPPVSRYVGRAVMVRGLAGLPGLEKMAANPQWGISECDPPVEITPETAARVLPLTKYDPVRAEQ